MLSDYYEDQRYCANCDAYVFYLLSPATAFCSYCGQTVTLFSESDLASLRHGSAGYRTRHSARSGEGEYQDAS